MEGSAEEDSQFEGSVKILMEMGFEKEQAEEALVKTGGQSIDLAAAYLLNNGLPEGENLDDEWEDVEYNFKMVFVVNTDLKMSIGKTAAQVAHGCLGLYKDIVEKREYRDWKNGIHMWTAEGQKKVVLSGNNAEQLLQLQEKAKSSEVPCHIVQDAGHTEVEPGSVTVLALFGGEEEVNQITGSLRLLK
ncbi:probable peptidyl-tRNA hydrolase 2 [Macrosteles quadrilineatus]|uniref:probable peptidyl-tRNA hydrolase 2 n=1 Tax=Macrosteles quadrilineatus TaxID=74068 RepID=UPI0023E34A3E|nr:probable peptidyl-tRNA hydrolase 2 [Macrosteles quadrilineatus]XP_054269464.1 probable peptidyl-tRNA hydrolase 2 [Macrosteles quadrilineatus]